MKRTGVRGLQREPVRACGVWLFLLLPVWGAGCTAVTAPSVKSAWQPETHTASGPQPVRPFLWTVRCAASSGEHCAGDPVLSFPADREYCRHDYQITEGPHCDTLQRVSVNGPGSLKVHVRAAGGPAWNPYASRIGLKIRGWGVLKQLDPHRRAALPCAAVKP